MVRRDELEVLIGRSVLAAEAIASEARRQLVNAVVSGQFTLDDLRIILEEWIPLAAQSLADVDVAARVVGFQEVVERLPELLERAVQEIAPLEAVGTVIRFPAIESAAENLVSRNIVTRDVFDQLNEEARERAFTVARLSAEDAIETIRNALAQQVLEPSLQGLRVELAERLAGSDLGPAHIENIYRTNIQAAFHQAMDEMASSPIVEEVFPYQEYLAIHDSRAREEHLALEGLGLSGTGVYRRDDPMWNFFLPPWGFNCRCTVNLLTVEAAAKRGVQEAVQWLATGIRPQPGWRLDDIPFRPPEGFVGPGRRR